jgi:hypothetical protein
MVSLIVQVYENSNKANLKTVLLFLAVLFVAYLPITTFQFFIKNDAFNGYFPPKFFMSESIHAGHLPLWNPYINFGIPQYGDMSSGYWSPVTWLMASTIGYNAYTFTLEILFYIILGGIGVYKLLGIWQVDKKVRLIAGIAFMCCGYNIGHLQHFNWLSGAAFLPWCLWAYLKAIDKFSFKSIARAALLFYLLFSSAHPGISIGAFYFFLAVMIFHLFSKRKSGNQKDTLKQSLKIHSLLILLLLLLSAGMISGYLDILPHFSRGEKLNLQTALDGPSNIQSWVSTILPFASVKNDSFFNTELTVRNCYFSLTLLLFFILAFLKKKTRWQLFLLFTALFFALLSSGGMFKLAAYKLMPGISYVRLNGEFRIFTLLCFIIIAAIELDKWIKEKNRFEGLVKKLFLAINIILLAVIVIGIYRAIINKESFIFSLKNIIADGSLSGSLKKLIDAVTFYDTFWIQGIIQLIILRVIRYCLIHQKMKLLVKVVMVDMILATLLNIPYTGVGNTSLASVQQVLNKSTKGIPIPILHPIKNNDTLTRAENELIGDWSMYNKQIGTARQVVYPINLKLSDTYFENENADQSISVKDRPYLFTAQLSNEKIMPSTTDTIKVKDFSPDKISIEANTQMRTNLVYLQNYYPHWFYKDQTGKKPVIKAGINFMSAPLNNGQNNISFSFEPVLIKWMMAISALSFIALSIFSIIVYVKRPSLS